MSGTGAGERHRPGGQGVPVPSGPGQAYLTGRLKSVLHRVQTALAQRARDTDGEAPDPFQSLYISPSAVTRLMDRLDAPVELARHHQAWLAATEAFADTAEGEGHRVPLRHLARAFGLQPLDTELLMTVLAPDLDARFERFYAYLNDDPAQYRPTVGLALRLCGADLAEPWDRARLITGPLVTEGLLGVIDDTRPHPTRPLRVNDQITAYLLQHHTLPPVLRGILTPPPSLPPLPASCTARLEEVTALLTAHAPLVHLYGPPGSPAALLAHTALHTAGRPARTLTLPTDPGIGPGTIAELCAAALLEARLDGTGLHLDAEHPPPPSVLRTVLDTLTDTALPLPLALTTTTPWDPAWSPTPPPSLHCPPLPAAERTALWHHALTPVTPPADATRIAAHMSTYRASPHHIHAAVHQAHTTAHATGTPLDTHRLHQALRSRHTGRLHHLTRRIQPAVTWHDLVVPPLVSEQLHDLTHRARHREKVLGQWHMRPGGGRGLGTCALFSGESGTGKTLAAEVIAADLHLDLYVINLATVIDKYIGETEKNLEHIFTEAETADGVLLFDEADALFGKRSETKDARDRYANVETAYLLQRLEAFNGLALLTTNLYNNIDSAFVRRLDMIIHFPLPNPAQRQTLWETSLPPGLPRSPDLDLPHIATTYELTGGSIRSCAINAAYHTAATNQPLTTTTLLNAIRTEHRKLGHLINNNKYTYDPNISTSNTLTNGTYRVVADRLDGRSGRDLPPCPRT